jgi:tetratricopeptide (TPR) repeat protein
MDRVPARAAVLAAVIALLLSTILVPKLRSATPSSDDVLVQVLGGTADLAADKAYQEADVYFHGGNARRQKASDRPAYELPFSKWIARMQGEAAPAQHRHLAGVEEKEILPWFAVAVRLNPHHIEAWSTGSYWYFRTGNREKALSFVSEGVRNNPSDYRLYLDRGIILYHVRDWDKSVRDLEAARGLWKNLNEDSPYDLKAIERYLSYVRSRRVSVTTR